MTEWNPDNPFDLGVWENLGLPPPLPGTRPEGYTPPKLPIPPILDPQDLCRSPEAKKARKSLKLKKPPPPSMECEASATEEESQASTSRFVSPTKSLDTYQRGHVPKNTEVNTQWAYATLTSGRLTRATLINHVLKIFSFLIALKICHTGYKSMFWVRARRVARSIHQKQSTFYFVD